MKALNSCPGNGTSTGSLLTICVPRNPPSTSQIASPFTASPAFIICNRSGILADFTILSATCPQVTSSPSIGILMELSGSVSAPKCLLRCFVMARVDQSAAACSFAINSGFAASPVRAFKAAPSPVVSLFCSEMESLSTAPLVHTPSPTPLTATTISAAPPIPEAISSGLAISPSAAALPIPIAARSFGSAAPACKSL